jgi:hypothetical protein
MSSSTYPAEFFKTSEIKSKAGYCFVLMPFAEGLNDIFQAVRATLQSPPWNFECKRADDFFGGGHILGDILQGIGEAQVLIADLTDRNPNVFYELGIAHVVRKAEDIILLTQNMASVPFDLQSFRCIQYSQGTEGSRKLQEDLARALKEMVNPTYRIHMKQGEAYDFPHKLHGDLNCLYDFSIFGDFLGIDGAKFTLRLRRYSAGNRTPDILPKSYHGLARGQCTKMPNIPWELRLENTGNEAADLTLFRSAVDLANTSVSLKPPAPRDNDLSRTTDLPGEVGSDARSASTWIWLSSRWDLRKGQRLRLILGRPAGPRKKTAKKVVVRFLRDDDDESKPVGVITPTGISVPEDRVLDVAIPADFANVRVISIHGGENPWKRFPLGKNNGLPVLIRAELIEFAKTGLKNRQANRRLR